jgi:hypothetical protein
MPLTTIRRERILPLAGEVLVGINTRVEALTVVARAKVPGRYRILEVAQTLRVPPDAADKYIRVRPGRPVKAGETVATRRVALGLFSRAVRAPQSAVVAAVGGGRVLLETAGRDVELRAYLPGAVVNVTPKAGVLVETVGALIQGVWGAGAESFGVLKVLVDEPDAPLRARAIDVACHGAVVVGGSTMDQDALQQALELQVRGIVIGSVDPTLVDMVKQMPFPVIATEGFGDAPMASPIFQLLRTNDGREAALSGRTQSRWTTARPEVIIPLPVRTAPAPTAPGAPLEAGVEVRVIRGPVTGAVGTVREVRNQPAVLETGARVQGAIVAFKSTEAQFVPFHNLELLG